MVPMARRRGRFHRMSVAAKPMSVFGRSPPWLADYPRKARCKSGRCAYARAGRRAAHRQRDMETKR
ncbi:hypothetical protein A8H35_21140 [Burkholderia thailandensis]|nr:hypothetical protein A8H31_10415 [Burkholderia thailandensis]AWY60830.1 hypothetical protein A8H35_21140 [Burkholderia thailandensis]AWY64883.1 hypothetical protein A8H36_06190 [Burkholderia thailandensis]NOK40316.1 hypothetical protein [Burkholderia thailandensis]NOK51996.1 hypothetical protein [Burkholderia thailandensis]